MNFNLLGCLKYRRPNICLKFNMNTKLILYKLPCALDILMKIPVLFFLLYYHLGNPYLPISCFTGLPIPTEATSTLSSSTTLNQKAGLSVLPPNQWNRQNLRAVITAEACLEEVGAALPAHKFTPPAICPLIVPL